MQLFLKRFLFMFLGAILIVSSTVCYEAAVEKVVRTCGRPNLPPNARIRHNSLDNFSENETINVLCEENQFPHHVQKRTCRHCQWQGPQARCGKAVSSKVVRMEAFHCEDTNNRILSLELNQTDAAKSLSPANSFHFHRISSEIGLSVSGSSCFRWIVKFDRKIEIAFLLVYFSLSNENGSKDTPVINVNIAHRECKLQHTSVQKIKGAEVLGFYFFCDLKTAIENDTKHYKTDYLVTEILNSKTSNKTVALEALFVGEIYKKTINGKLVPDCGKLEIQKTGIIGQVELNHVQVYCNDSFVELGGSNRMHKFTCDWNGQRQAKVPLILFVDDDYYVSVRNLVKSVKEVLRKDFQNEVTQNFDTQLDSTQPFDGRLYMGYLFPYSRPIRQLTSKHYISLAQYPYSRYPPYITGGCFLVTNSTVTDLYYASLYTKTFLFDDVYLGILAKKMNIQLRHNPNIYFEKYSYYANGYGEVVASHGYNDPEEMIRVWTEQKSFDNT